MSTDPTDIRSLAIDVDDVVTAYEAARDGTPTVIRITPPFSGRMRARIHRARRPTSERKQEQERGCGSEPTTTGLIHIDPRALIDDAAPAYPTPEETEDRLRATECEYSIELHHDRHVDAVREWRATVGSHVVETVAIETPDGPHTVEVKPLGSPGTSDSRTVR